MNGELLLIRCLVRCFSIYSAEGSTNGYHLGTQPLIIFHLFSSYNRILASMSLAKSRASLVACKGEVSNRACIREALRRIAANVY